MYLFRTYFLQKSTKVENEEKKETQLISKEKLKGRPWWQIITAFIVLTAGFLSVGYSRFILGVHSANQILYGFIIGLWSVLFCTTTLDPIIESMVENLKNKSA